MALTQNRAAIPNPTMITPPIAGPIARLILMPTLLAALACQAGASKAQNKLIRNVNSNKLAGLTRSAETITANIAETMAIKLSRTIIKRRLSIISASAPAGTANMNIERLSTAWTSDTIKGLESRFVINQLEEALYIQPPTLETTVASHSMEKMRC